MKEDYCIITLITISTGQKKKEILTNQLKTFKKQATHPPTKKSIKCIPYIGNVYFYANTFWHALKN